MENIRNTLLVLGRILEIYDETAPKFAQTRVDLEVVRLNPDTSTEIRQKALSAFEAGERHMQILESAILKLTSQDSMDGAREVYEELSAAYAYVTELHNQVVVAEAVVETKENADLTEGEEYEDQAEALSRSVQLLAAAKERAEILGQALALPVVPRVNIEIPRML